jgi:peptidoglycan hydrolase-like amidase
VVSARAILLCAVFFFCASACAQGVSTETVDIGVLGIFHPTELLLSAGEKQELLVSGAGLEFFVTAGSTCHEVRIRATGNELTAKCGKKELRAKTIHVTSRNQDAATFVLAIPGKIKRSYRGTLRLVAKDGVLTSIIQMDLETAVGSVVRAEMTEDTPLEALKAQAVATRSYFMAGGGRHADFDFCDLTHCQFLREPPPTDSLAAQAAEQTRGMILAYNGKAVAAMYTRSCPGRTRTAKEIGLSDGAYPYFSVICDFCYKNPVTWTRKVSSEDATILRSGEAGRLNLGRRLGWSAVPSNNFSVHEGVDGAVVLHGIGQGHGVGLCQRGARAMAENGARFREILEHYFPNTRIIQGRTSL